MNILLINHNAGSLSHGMEYRPYYLAREWVRLGNQVTIVAASFAHVHTHQPEHTGLMSVQDIDGIKYVWLKTPQYSGNGIGRVRNVAAFVGQLYRLRKSIIGLSLPDVVIASSTYPFDIFPAHYIAKKTGAKLVFEVHDLWPLSLIELGGMSRWHPFIMATQVAEWFAYRVSAKVVSILPKTLEHMTSHGLSPRKFVHIPNGIDAQEWKGADAVDGRNPYKEIIDNFKSNGHFVVGYAGAYGMANSLSTLVDAADLLKEKNITFLLLGNGPAKHQLQDRAGKGGLQNILFLDAVSKTAVPSILAAVDACYIGWPRVPFLRFGISPNKLMDYMAAGKPIIHSVEAGNDIVAESRCGLSVPPENPQAIADAILELMRMDPQERAAMGLRGKEFVLQHHDYRVLAQQFLSIMA